MDGSKCNNVYENSRSPSPTVEDKFNGSSVTVLKSCRSDQSDEDSQSKTETKDRLYNKYNVFIKCVDYVLKLSFKLELKHLKKTGMYLKCNNKIMHVHVVDHILLKLILDLMFHC